MSTADTLAFTGCYKQTKSCTEWPDLGVAVEYNSSLYHTGTAAITRDANRNNVIESKGKSVFVLTWHSVSDAQAFENTVELIRSMAGLKDRTTVNRRKFLAARRVLRECVLPTLDGLEWQ